MPLSDVYVQPDVKKNKWGLFGKIIGGVLGAVAAPFTAGGSLAAIPAGFALGSTAGEMAGGLAGKSGVTEGKKVDLLSRYATKDPDVKMGILDDAAKKVRSDFSIPEDQRRSFIGSTELAKQKIKESLG